MNNKFRIYFLFAVLYAGGILILFLPMLTVGVLWEYGLLSRDPLFGLLALITNLVWMMVFFKLLSRRIPKPSKKE